MGLYKLCTHKGRARDRCKHPWWGSFRGRRVSLAKWVNRARSAPKQKLQARSTSCGRRFATGHSTNAACSQCRRVRRGRSASSRTCTKSGTRSARASL